jgi:hypothetical protein
MTGTAWRGQYPRTYLPGRCVPYVLAMPTLELRHPVVLLVLVKAHDAALWNHQDRLVEDGRGRRASLRWVTFGAATVRTGRRPPRSLTPLNSCSPAPRRMGTR